jgi:hypothetical protein
MEIHLNSTFTDEESTKLANILKLGFIIVILAVGLFAGFYPLLR